MGNSNSRSKHEACYLHPSAKIGDPVSFHKRDDALEALNRFCKNACRCEKPSHTLSGIYLGPNHTMCTAQSSADIENETIELTHGSFHMMGASDPKGEELEPIKAEGKIAITIAEQVIRHWALYNKVAFEEVIILVCGKDVRTFLKVKAPSEPHLIGLDSKKKFVRADDVKEGENYKEEKRGEKQEILVSTREL